MGDPTKTIQIDAILVDAAGKVYDRYSRETRLNENLVEEQRTLNDAFILSDEPNQTVT